MVYYYMASFIVITKQNVFTRNNYANLYVGIFIVFNAQRNFKEKDSAIL